MRRISFSFSIFLVLLSACATSRWISTPVYNQKQVKVSLEYRQEGDIIIDQKYSHPFNINTTDLEGLFNDLAYVEKLGMVEDVFKNQEQEPVFLADEVARLAPAISEALAKADSKQRVRFQSINRGGGLIFASRRVTEGVVFAESPGKLNIVFNIINHELAANDPDEVPQEYKNREPLTIKESWAVLIPMTSYARLQQLDNGKNNPIWIIADLNKFQTVSKVKAPPVTEKPENKAQPASLEKIEAKESVEQPVKALPDKNENIKSKLQLLKELFEGGLITEAEYEAKKKEVLNEIK